MAYISVVGIENTRLHVHLQNVHSEMKKGKTVGHQARGGYTEAALIWIVFLGFNLRI